MSIWYRFVRWFWRTFDAVDDWGEDVLARRTEEEDDDVFHRKMLGLGSTDLSVDLSFGGPMDRRD